MLNKQLGKLFKSLQEIQTGEIHLGAIGEQVLFKPGKSLGKWDREEDQGLSSEAFGRGRMSTCPTHTSIAPVFLTVFLKISYFTQFNLPIKLK